jgi:ribonucleoside-diphosphate reductase alpha chain
VLWESDEHLEQTEYWNEWWEYFAIKASMEIAKEKGYYPMFPGSDWATGAYFDDRGLVSRPGGPDWDGLKADVMKYGIRNGWWGAIAPTGSTSLIAGSTAGIDPVYKRFFIEEKKNGFIPQTAPNLSQETMWYYKEALKIDQTWSIKAAGIRQKHIDQAQSFNLYINSDVVTAKDFLEMYILAWKVGMKTIYYIRSRSQEQEDCESCSA